MTPTITACLREARARIEPAEAELLLLHALCGHDRTRAYDRAWLYTHGDDLLEAAVLERFQALLSRREAGEPVAYLTGRRGFWTLELETTTSALIPRPETELLVEAVLERIPGIAKHASPISAPARVRSHSRWRASARART